MRIRAGHVILALLALLTGFVVLATMRVRDVEQEVAPAAPLPPVGGDMDQVPVIEVETRALNLGVVPNDRDGKGSLRVYNRGRRPLEIRDIRSSCACTRGEMPSRSGTIPPGGHADMEVTVYPRRIFGFHSIKTLTIMSNDPANPSLEVTIEAKVDPEFALDPENFEFGKVEKGTEARRTLRLVTLAGKPVKVTGITSYLPSDEPPKVDPWRFELEELPAAEWKSPEKPEWLVHAVLADWAPSGHFADAVFIATDVERFPYHRILAEGEVAAPYTVEAEMMGRFFVLPPDGAPGVIRVRSAEPVECPGVSVPDGMIAARAVADGDGMGFRLEFTMKPDSTPGRHEEPAEFDILCGGRPFKERLMLRWFSVQGLARP